MAVALAGLAAALGGCSRPAAKPVDEGAAYAAAKKAYLAAESAEAKAKIAEKYLEELPGGEHAAAFAGAEIETRGRELGEDGKAFAVVSRAMERAADPGVRFEIAMELLPLSFRVHRPLDLKKIVDGLEAKRPLSFQQNVDVAEAAVAHSMWELAWERSQKALAQATPEGYRADYPDTRLDAEKIAARVGKRRELALAYAAWSAFNLGRREEADKLFGQAEEHATFNYLGACDTPLRRFEGEAELAQEHWERAAELLEPQALFGADPLAVVDLKKAYAGRTGSEKGFGEYLAAARRRLARNVDDFQLADYDGKLHALSEKRGKVVLLAFWFPT
jgi:hypothetical protein